VDENEKYMVFSLCWQKHENNFQEARPICR